MELESGSITVDDLELGSLGLDAVRGRKMCIIPQDPVLFDGNVRSNLGRSPEPKPQSYLIKRKRQTYFLGVCTLIDLIFVHLSLFADPFNENTDASIFEALKKVQLPSIDSLELRIESGKP